LDSVELETGKSPQRAVIWLHGLGADGHDFEPVVPWLKLPKRSPVRFVFPHAPIKPISVNNGLPMRAWYDIDSLDFNRRRHDEAGIRLSASWLAALIEREIARGVPAERIVVAGFSQGGVIALHEGLRHPRKLAGILALSTYLALAEKLDAERSTENTQTPIFLAHGLRDDTIHPRNAQAAKRALEEAGNPLTWQLYPMGHEVIVDELADVGQWLAGVLDC
jgi:phospholipase/carboxylesterase